MKKLYYKGLYNKKGYEIKKLYIMKRVRKLYKKNII